MINTLVTMVIESRQYILAELIIALIAAICGLIVKMAVKRWSNNRNIKFVEVFASWLPADDAPIAVELDKSESRTEQNVFFKGSMLKAIIENPSQKECAIARSWLVIDDIQPYEIRTLEVLGHLYNGRFVIYLINNGYTEIENVSVTIKGSYILGEERVFLDDNSMSKILNCKTEDVHFYVSKMRSGEICRSASYVINAKELCAISKGTNWIYVTRDVEYDSCDEKQNQFVASMVLCNNRVDVVFCEGGAPDVERYQVKILANSTLPNRKELPVEYNIGANHCKQLQVASYIDRSSTIQFHFELKPAGKKKRISKQESVSIAVPIYDADYGFFEDLRAWLDKNNITHYRYNDNPILQKEIEYHM